MLAIDGLDPGLVEKWRVGPLLQEVHGVHDPRAGLGEGEPIYTPLVWSSFLLGEPAHKYGLTMREVRIRRDCVGYGLLSPLYRLKLRLLGGRKLGVRRLLMKLGLYNIDRVARALHEIESLPPEAVERTFVREAERRGYSVWIGEFPGLGDPYYASVRAKFSLYFNLSLEERRRRAEGLYKHDKAVIEEASRALRDHDLVVCYVAIIDIANHMFYRPGSLRAMAMLASYYRRVAEDVEDAARGAEAVLIVSDHGYDPKTHSHGDWGFWSLNVEPPERPRTVLDFKKLILDYLLPR